MEKENAGRRGEWYKDLGKCIKKSRIEFPDPMLMTLDTPHGPITKFLKKCPKNAGKMRGKIVFPPFWFLIQKLDHNSGLNAKIRKKSQVIKSEGIICPKNAGKMSGKIIFPAFWFLIQKLNHNSGLHAKN